MRSLAIAGAMTAVLVLAPLSQAQEQPPRFVVNGVVLKPDGSALAWLQEPTFTKGVMLVRAGDSVGPYKVTGITEDRVELQGPAGKVIVRLYATATGGPAPAAAPKPPRPTAPTVVGGTPPPGAPAAGVATPATPGTGASGPASAAVQPTDTEDKKPSGGQAMGGRHGSEPLGSTSPLIGTPLFPVSGEATAQEKAAAAARMRVPLNQGFGFTGQGGGSQPSK